MKTIKQMLVDAGYKAERSKSNQSRMVITKYGKLVHKTPFASVDLAIELIQEASKCR